MTDVERKHFAAIEATLEVLKVQISALRHERAMTQPETPARTLPPSCTGIDGEHCGLKNDEARSSRATFTSPHAWVCTGCRMTSDGVTPS